MLISKAQIERIRGRFSAPDAITEISQAISLFQASGVYSTLRQFHFTNRAIERIMRRVFPNLKKGKVKW